ncbi:Six-hairpin glycosidase-like protein [Endogone sp. FLAS-F59071]|nr:Six-hairpin glycosidase-like protein [Endogone sp. FLAS-F59071]|eukprot:RUS18368.1 Six-hairpin glycosidase-like protein [Endogone sp. FLAS-F59071]
MIQWGTTWLIKAHASVDTLYVQVGNVTLDESYSGPDTGIPTPRPSYFVNSTHTGTDVVAEAAAAFASASVLFTVLGNVTQNSNDTAYAALLLTHAEQLFDFAVNAKPYNMYQTSDTALNGKYISTGYTDELFWASVHLYRATKNVTYLDTARQFYTSFNLSGSTRAVNWDWKTGAAYVLMAELTYGDVVTGLQATNDSASWQLIAEQFLDSITNVTEQVSTQGAYLTQGGLWWYNGESEGNSLSISMTQSMLLFLYSSSVLRRISGSSQQGSAAIRAARYETFAQTQIDYMLGLNPSEVMFMAGERPNSPQNLDSSLLGSEVISSNVTLPPKRLFVLKGALVSGPNNLDSFDDNSSDANSTLVGLQYNAPLQVLLARQVIYSTKNPFYIALTNTNSSTPAGATLTSSNNGFPVWAIVLIVVLGVLLLLALLLCLFCCMRRRNRAAAAGAPTNQASIGTATAAAAGPDRAMAAPEMTEVVVAEEDTALANTAPSGGAFEVTTEELDEVEIPVFAGSDEAPTNESGFAVESEELEDATAAAAAAAAAQAAESKKKGGWLFGKKKAAKDEVHGFPVETTSLTAGAVGSEAEVEEVDIDDVEINGPVDEIAIAGAATTSAANIGINKDAAAATGVFGGAAREEKVEIDEVDTITTKKVGFAGAAAAAAAALVGRGKGAAGAKEIEIDETDVTTIREVELGTGGRKGFRGAGAEEVEIDEVDVTTTKIDELSGVGVGGLAGGAVSKKGFSATRGGGKEVVITEVDISPKGKLTRTKTETETVSDGPGKLTRTTTTITTTTSGKK